MADTPQDHPAITVPASVLTTGQILAAPGIFPQVKGSSGSAAAATNRNYNEQILDELFPGGIIRNVSVRPHEDNPNPMLQSMKDKNGDWIFGAWTNAANLIYIDDSWPDHFKAYVLYHEVTHIKQFRTKGSPPSSFQEMLGFEMNSYPDTEKWVNSKKGEKYFLVDNQFDEDEYQSIKDAANAVTTEVTHVFIGSLALKVMTIATQFPLGIAKVAMGVRLEEAAPLGMPLEEIVLRNMTHNSFLPAIRNNSLYKVADLYLQNEKGNAERWKALGY